MSATPADLHTNPLAQMLPSVFSDNSNIMLAAIISLLLVILFVLLLHLYAKWFLAHAHAQAQARRRRRRRRRTASVTVSDVIGPARFHHFHSFNLQDSPISNSPTKGLDSASIAAIPVFVYEADTMDEEGDERELECVICLSVFEDGESGRSLPKCGHAFHVECIDMWLSSHSNCPICRAPIPEHDSQLGSVHEDDSSAMLEIVIDSPGSEISENDRGTESISTNNDNENGGVSDSAISISETSSSLLGCSLKRMFSKVFPSSNVSELST
ncbi:RING-H2 finger protein ATL63 [Neltuma alba]|uniref:RING-H2 finger protein ATL63 n=1 Tax=Neltuma alba TaxID=207710 RepID=UPI0010A2B780|nr:RING-H2 finger protein ATL63 [Prosopis alba]